MESKKTEKSVQKLVSALYLLTSFFSDLEPMKWRLRELGGRLISVKEGQSTVLEIMGLLSVAKNAGLISDTNFEIIHKEFEKLSLTGENMKDMLASIPEPQLRNEPSSQLPQHRVELDATHHESVRPQYGAHEYLPAVERHEHIVKDRNVRETHQAKDRSDGAVAIKKNSRQTAILSLLKKKKEIMVRDVSPFIDGVSEKTIQRELLAMVNKGILRKEGEKRWSRYSLAE